MLLLNCGRSVGSGCWPAADSDCHYPPLCPQDAYTAERTHIITKELADFKLTSQDQLGQPKNLGLGEKGVPEDHVYGKPTRTFVEWDAGRLMSGDYTQEEQEPDADLGRSLRPGYRNIAPDDKVLASS